MKKANTICKYSGCTLGKDGKPKEYYSCGYCTAQEHWKSMACCREHYDLYIKEVLAAREHGEEVDTLPNRTDMTKEEVKALQERPIDEVKAETEKELKEYADANGHVDIIKAVDKVNKSLDKKNKKKE